MKECMLEDAEVFILDSTYSCHEIKGILKCYIKKSVLAFFNALANLSYSQNDLKEDTM